MSTSTSSSNLVVKLEPVDRSEGPRPTKHNARSAQPTAAPSGTIVKSESARVEASSAARVNATAPISSIVAKVEAVARSEAPRATQHDMGISAQLAARSVLRAGPASDIAVLRTMSNAHMPLPFTPPWVPAPTNTNPRSNGGPAVNGTPRANTQRQTKNTAPKKKTPTKKRKKTPTKKKSQGDKKSQPKRRRARKKKKPPNLEGNIGPAGNPRRLAETAQALPTAAQPGEGNNAETGMSEATLRLNAQFEEEMNRPVVTSISVPLSSSRAPLQPPARLDNSLSRASSLTRNNSALPPPHEVIVVDDDGDDNNDREVRVAPPPLDLPMPVPDTPDSELTPLPDTPIMVASPRGPSGLLSAPPPVSPEQRKRRRRDLPVPVTSAAEPIVVDDDDEDHPRPRKLPATQAAPVLRQRSRADERLCELHYYGPRRGPEYEPKVGVHGLARVLVEGSETRPKGSQAAGTGKGFGLRATCDIKNGQAIVHESPLLVITEGDLTGVPTLFDALSDEERRICLSFPWTTEAADPFEGMISTNFIPHTGPNGEDQSAIFEYISRTNHSCSPNAHWYWDNTAQERYLMALRDITAGEEITASYVDEFDLLKSRDERRQILSNLHEFQCLCCACNADVKSCRASDKNRKRIMNLLVRWEAVRLAKGIEVLAKEPTIINEISEVIGLLKKEKVEIHLDYPIEILFQIHAAHGRRELARETAKVLVQTLRRKAGRRQNKSWKEMQWARDPESWQGYGSLLAQA